MSERDTCGPFASVEDARTWLDNSGTVDWTWFGGYDPNQHAHWLRSHADGEHPDKLLALYLICMDQDPADYSLAAEHVEAARKLATPTRELGHASRARADEVLRDKAHWYPTLESVTDAIAALDEKPPPSSQQAAQARQEDRANLERLAECYRLGWLKEGRS